MEKKFISSTRYKKTSSEDKKNRRTESISKKIKKASQIEEHSKIDEDNVRVTPKRKPKKKNKLTIFLFIIAILLILCALRLALKDENESFFNIFGTKVKEDAIDKLSIALVDNTEVLNTNTKNVILTELNNYTYGTLLKITTNYEIKFDLLQEVEKKSNKEYILKIKENNLLTAGVLIARLNSYKESSSKYYANCAKIDSMEEIDNKTVRIKLNENNPWFVYNLQLPITFSTTNTGLYNVNTSRGASDKVTYIKKDYLNVEIPNTIDVMTAKDDDEAIELFKSGNIDMFFTDSYDIGEKLGKVDMDIRSYSNGKCLFLFGNSKSEYFSKKEIRKAIAYSIDREKIRKDIYLNSGTIIDIPELYSEVKFKYDIYGAQNLLLSAGYTLSNSVFVKDGKSINLTMLVNKNDETKVRVATYIKEDLENIGIKVNIKTLSSSDISKQIKLGEFDLVLADVNLNENPDISFIKEYISINDSISSKIDELSNSKTAEEIGQCVTSLTNLMSDEVVCVGIHADSTYMVVKKGINVFSNAKYMNIFSDVLLTK